MYNVFIVKGDVKYRLEGEVELGSQFYFTLEPQTCLCVPMEDGINLYSATQWMDCTQVAVSEALNIPANA